jgi:hypothetical protein
MGAGNAGSSGGSGGGFTAADDIRQNYQATSKTKISQKAKDKVITDQAKDNTNDFRNMKYEGSKAPSLIGKALDFVGVSKKTFNVNKAYYEKNVVGKNNFTKSPDDFKSYMNKRGRGEVDAMGRAISGGGDGGENTQPGITKNIGGRTIQTTAPTEAEVSQSEAANADAAALKVKKRGRSASIMTGPKGVTRTSTDYSLGKKSLLGQV